MAAEMNVCGICAWRRECQKRFKLDKDSLVGSHCPDYTRDLTIKPAATADNEDEKLIMDKMVQMQVAKWRKLFDQAMRQGLKIENFKGGPIITVSREAGAGGSDISRRLAKAMGMDLIGGQIIQHVADSAKMSRKVIETLDEREVTFRETLLSSLFGENRPWPGEYLHHLTRVIGTIGIFGNVVIVGRGANFVLPQDRIFRTRIIAPMESRIRYFMEDRGYTRAEAEQYIVKRDNNRKAFVRKYFNADIADTQYYDMIINTEKISMAQATEAIIVAFNQRRKRKRADAKA
ncbi:MAG TPA: cytidylate kinase-like family protein [Smithella sp.]|nr:cytidylate kinase-like family protein [Smithella sp.]MDM7987855.1 cytidylate kinase-like family protein [Smithella sp.]HNY50657.1 cytidylate kinase-like family protein [Smithella sp.]HOG89112.1 cytidylate kinase-like family protein [Smithella sp.]HOU50232.1 cytidylate kinase-like family protein [Smithella sp.]